MNAANDIVIHIDGLTKDYNGFRALDNLHLDVYRGEIFGYLGPNGAGKTTTIRLLLDLIRPTSGHATIFGQDAHFASVAVHQHLGNLPGELALYEHMTGWELVRYLGGLRGGVDEDYVKELASRLEMDMSRKIKTCSSGMKRKLGLIQGLMHRPKLLIFDEPTLGLDPLVQQTFYQLMHEVSDAGTTVFMSSHNLREVEHVCDRVGILHKGKLETVGRITELKKVRFRWMTLHLADTPNKADFDKLPGVSDVTVHNSTLEMRLTGELAPVIKAAARYHVVDMTYQEPSLEEIFLQYYGEAK